MGALGAAAGNVDPSFWGIQGGMKGLAEAVAVGCRSLSALQKAAEQRFASGGAPELHLPASSRVKDRVGSLQSAAADRTSQHPRATSSAAALSVAASSFLSPDWYPDAANSEGPPPAQPDKFGPFLDDGTLPGELGDGSQKPQHWKLLLLNAAAVVGTASAMRSASPRPPPPPEDPGRQVAQARKPGVSPSVLDTPATIPVPAPLPATVNAQLPKDVPAVAEAAAVPHTRKRRYVSQNNRQVGDVHQLNGHAAPATTTAVATSTTRAAAHRAELQSGAATTAAGAGPAGPAGAAASGHSRAQEGCAQMAGEYDVLHPLMSALDVLRSRLFPPSEHTARKRVATHGDVGGHKGSSAGDAAATAAATVTAAGAGIPPPPMASTSRPGRSLMPPPRAGTLMHRADVAAGDTLDEGSTDAPWPWLRARTGGASTTDDNHDNGDEGNEGDRAMAGSAARAAQLRRQAADSPTWPRDGRRVGRGSHKGGRNSTEDGGASGPSSSSSSAETFLASASHSRAASSQPSSSSSPSSSPSSASSAAHGFEICGADTELPATKRTVQLRWALCKLAAAKSRRMRVGAYVLHVPSGEASGVNAGDAFPLASIVKTAYLVEAARQMQAAEEEAVAKGPGNTPVELRECDKCIGSGKLTRWASGALLTFGECVEWMMTISDNTAADLVLHRLGLSRVRASLRAMGLRDTEVYLSQRQAYLLALGKSPQLSGMGGKQLAAKWLSLPLDERVRMARDVERVNVRMSMQAFQALESTSERQQAQESAEAYEQDLALVAAVDNVGSPRDMGQLLVRLVRAELLSPGWTEYCMRVLGSQRYGRRRMLAKLPASTKVYHKTGSITGVVNHAGVIDVGSPDNRVVVACLISGVVRGAERDAEATIASIARLAYDTYVGDGTPQQ
eukprot:jgi/Mesvir1/14416/Mv09800-RA.1